MERQIGKYTLKSFGDKSDGSFDGVKVSCGKVHFYIDNLTIREFHTITNSNKEADITHILKMERLRRKRELETLEKLLTKGD